MKPRILSTARLSLPLAAALAALLAVPAARATTLTWDANGATAGLTDGAGLWDTGTLLWWNGTTNVNWSSGSDVIFGNGGAGGAVTLAAPTTVNSFTFAPFTGTYTLGTATQAITLNAGVTMNYGAGAVSIISPLTLGGVQTWTNNSTSVLTFNSGAGLNLNGNRLTFSGSGTYTAAAAGGTISGAGGITMSGTGRVILGAAATVPTLTYSGDTIVNSGIIQFSGNMSANSCLILQGGVYSEYYTATVNRGLGTATNQIQVLGGASGFGENGAAVMTINLGGASAAVQWGSTYFQPTTFVLGDATTANNGCSTIFQNPIDLNGADRTVSSVGLGSTTSATMSGAISNSAGTAGFIKTGPAKLILTGANTFNGAVTVNQGILSINSINTVANANPLGKSSAAAANLLLANGTTLQFTGAAASCDRSFTINGTVNGASATLDASGSGALNLTSTSSPAYGTASQTRTLILTGTYAAAANILAANIADNSGSSVSVTKNGAAQWTLSGASTYTGATTINTGTLNLTGSLSGSNVTTNGGILTESAAGSIGGAANFIQDTGSVTSVLGGTNSYTGTTTICAGTLQFSKQASLYNNTSASWTAANINVKNLATLALNVDSGGTAGFTSSSLNTLLGNITVASSATQGMQLGAILALDTTTATGGTFTQGNALTDSTGTNGGLLGLAKLGAGTLILNQANTYTGVTIISAGVLQLGSGSTAGTLSTSSAILDNGTLTINRSNPVAQGTDFSANPIAGTGAFIQAGAGTTTLSAANTFSGTTTVNAGVLTLTNALALQNSTLVTTGAGTLTLSGPTTLTLGGLSGATGALATIITSGYTSTVTALTLNTAGTPTYGGVIADGATGMTLTMAGAGTQTLQGVDTYSGATTLKAGTLTLSGTGSILNSAITFSGGNLTLTNTAAETGSGRISDSAAITSSYGGTFTYNNTATNTIAYAETVGSVALTGGQLNLVESNNQNATTNSQMLTLSGLTHTGSTNSSAITFSALTTGPNTTTNKFVVTGASATTAGQIIGTWATTGTATNALTDYAVYNGSAQVVPAAIAASAQSTWTTAANAYTANAGLGGLTLTGTRNITALRSISATNTASATSGTTNITLTSNTYAVGDAVVMTGSAPTGFTAGNVYYVVATGTNTFQLSATSGGAAITPTSSTSPTVVAALLLSTGNNLGTTGILNGVATTMYITATGTGVVTLPSTTSDFLHVNPGAGAININPIIANNGAGVLTLVKDGSGILTLNNNASTYSGGTVVNAGSITTATGGGSTVTFFGSGLVTINPGATLSLNNTYVGNNVTLNNTSVTAGNSFGSTMAGSTITLNGITTFNISGNLTISGNMTGTGGLIKTGASNVPVTGTNNYTGTTTISGGPLTFSKAAALYNGTTASWTPANITVASGATLGLNYGGASDFTNSQVTTLLGNLTTGISNNGLLAGSSVAFDTSNGNGAYSGTITDSTGAGGGSVGFNKIGGNTLTLSGNNTFTGPVSAGGPSGTSGGTLAVYSFNSVNGGTPLLASSSLGCPTTVANGTITLGNGSNNQGVGLTYLGTGETTDRVLAMNSGIGAGGTALTIDQSGTGLLKFTSPFVFTGATGSRILQLQGSTAGTGEWAAVLADVIPYTNTLGITKVGSGTWTLSAANTYTGLTTVNGGILAVSSLANAGSNSNLGAYTTAGPGGISLGAGTLRYTGSTTSVDRGFTLTANGTIDVNSASTSLTLGASSLAGATLTVTGGSGSSLTLGTTMLTGAAILNPTTATLTMGSIIEAQSLTLGGTNTGNSVTGVIATGTGALTKSGTSTWTLSGSNSYTGVTTISAGTLAVSSLANALSNSNLGAYPTAGAAGIALNGGTLQYTGSTGVSVDRGFTLGGNATVDVNPASTALTLGACSLGNFTLNVTGGSGSSLNIGATALTAAATLNPTTASLTVASVSGTQNLTLGGTNAGNSVTGAIATSGSTLTKTGTGAWTLSGANSYTNTTTVQAGSLIAGTNSAVSTNGAFGNASSAIILGNGSTGASDAPAVLINGAYTVARAITVGSVADAGVAYNATIGGSNTSGTATYTGNITLNTTANSYTATLQAATGGTVEFSTGTWATNNKAIAVGSAGNTGTVKLSSNVTTTGGVSVNYGTLALNSTLTGGLTVNNGAILAPGGAGTTATATVAGATATTFNDGSIFSWDISSTGTSYDKLVSASGLVDGGSAGGSVLRIVAADPSFANTFWTTAHTWTDIFTTNGSTAIANWANIFTSVSLVNSSFTPITPPVDGNFVVSGNTLTWTAVPEPTSALAGLLLGAGLLRRRRK